MEPRAKSNLARKPLIPRPAIRPGHPFILHQTGSPPVSTSDFRRARQIRHEPRIRSAVNRFSSPPRKRILVSLAQTQGWRIVNRLNARTLKLNHNPQDGTIRELHEDTNRRFGGGSAVPRRRGASFRATIGGSAGTRSWRQSTRSRPRLPSRHMNTECSSSTSAIPCTAVFGPRCSMTANSISPSSLKNPKPRRRGRQSRECSCANGILWSRRSCRDGQGQALCRRPEPAHCARCFDAAWHPPVGPCPRQRQEIHRPHLSSRHARHESKGFTRVGQRPNDRQTISLGRSPASTRSFRSASPPEPTPRTRRSRSPERARALSTSARFR